LESLSIAFQLLHSLQPAVVIGLVGDEVIVDDMPMAKADTLGPLIRRLQQSGVERITVDRGVTTEDLVTFIDAIGTIERGRRRIAIRPTRSRRFRISGSGA